MPFLEMRNCGSCICRALVMSAAVLFVGTTVLFAQVDAGSITGTVRDSSGAVIPGAKVTLTNDDTGLVVTGTSGGAGEYTFAPIKIGHYSLAAEVKGFQRVEHTHVTVEVQQRVLVDFVLPPGQMTQTVDGHRRTAGAANARCFRRAGDHGAFDQRLALERTELHNACPACRRSNAGPAGHSRPWRKRQFFRQRTAPGAEQLLARRDRQQLQSGRFSERYVLCGSSAGRRDSGIQSADQRLQCRVRTIGRRGPERHHQIRARTNSTAMPGSFCATTNWMRPISSRTPEAYRRASIGRTSSASPSAVPFGRTRRSSSVTTKGRGFARQSLT